ncbi:transposase family protein, partial [bacterium]|nr:transposase family protein [bacterium]
QLAWHHVHNEAFRRLEGIPATVRVDNERTAVSRGAGAWGVINPRYRCFAKTLRFHIDACPPRSPGHKGKIERGNRDDRRWREIRQRHWDGLAELQAWTDAQGLREDARRRCPATGTSVLEAWEAEKRFLAPLPPLPEPFDVAVTRPVSLDGLVAFEGRQYTVPFAWVGLRVEVRGCAQVVQVLAEGQVVAEHPRHGRALLVLDPACYEGPSTARVVAPPPLGRMGRRLQEIAAMPPSQRPLDLYAALAEVAR